VLEEPTVLDENVYNMDETGVMLSMLGSVKVLAGREDLRNYRGARVKRTVVTAIECISAENRYLDPMDHVSHARMALRVLRISLHRFSHKLRVAHTCFRSANQGTGERQAALADLRRLRHVRDVRNPGALLC
jgi:hypothetical protein